jgi:hypothetical protein
MAHQPQLLIGRWRGVLQTSQALIFEDSALRPSLEAAREELNRVQKDGGQLPAVLQSKN